MYSEVVLVPVRDEALPDLQVALHRCLAFSFKYYRLVRKVDYQKRVRGWFGDREACSS